jgi:hypothetical protein
MIMSTPWGYAHTGVVWKITKTSASTAPSPTGSHTSNATATAIHISNDTGKHPIKGDTIQYIYTNSQHNNPLYRVVPIAIGNAQAKSLSQYDKEKYREMILDAAETVLGFFGFDRTVCGNIKKKKGRRKWYEELREERTKDIQAEMSE